MTKVLNIGFCGKSPSTKLLPVNFFSARTGIFHIKDKGVGDARGIFETYNFIVQKIGSAAQSASASLLDKLGEGRWYVVICQF